MPTLHEIAAEAMCSAVYNLPFSQFLGERPDPIDGTDVAWFKLSRDPEKNLTGREDPKQVMVAVVKAEGDVVEVRVGWLNITCGAPLRASQTFRIPTFGLHDAIVKEATEEVMLKVLGIYSDVLGETGLAGPDWAAVAIPPSEDDDETDPDDMAVPD